MVEYTHQITNPPSKPPILPLFPTASLLSTPKNLHQGAFPGHLIAHPLAFTCLLLRLLFDLTPGKFPRRHEGTQGPGHFTVRPSGPHYRAHPLRFGASQTCLRPVGRGVAPTPTNPLILAVGHTKRHRKAKKGGWAKGNQWAKASRTPRAMAKPRFWRPSGEARRARSSGLVIKPVSTRMAGAGTSRRTLK